MWLIPYPTLSTVTGFAVVYNGFRSRPWSVMLLLVGSFYVVFWILRLGVDLAAGLLLGGLTLLSTIIRMK